MVKKVPDKSNRKGIEIAGFVCSLIGILLFLFPYFGLPLSVLGTIFSRKRQTGLGITGLVIGIVGIIVNLFVFVGVIYLLAVEGV